LLTGAPQNIDVDFAAKTGTLNLDGSVDVGGTGTLDQGTGFVLSGITFAVHVTTTGYRIAIGTSALAATTVTAGTITIQ
jgi:hypothetical protein